MPLKRSCAYCINRTLSRNCGNNCTWFQSCRYPQVTRKWLLCAQMLIIKGSQMSLKWHAGVCRWLLCAQMLATKGSQMSLKWHAGCTQVYAGLLTGTNSRKCISAVLQVHLRCTATLSQLCRRCKLCSQLDMVCYGCLLFCYIIFCLSSTTRASPWPFILSRVTLSWWLVCALKFYTIWKVIACSPNLNVVNFQTWFLSLSSCDIENGLCELIS